MGIDLKIGMNYGNEDQEGDYKKVFHWIDILNLTHLVNYGV